MPIVATEEVGTVTGSESKWDFPSLEDGEPGVSELGFRKQLLVVQKVIMMR